VFISVSTIAKLEQAHLKKDTKEFLEEFREVMSSEPRRKGKPKLASPEEMKSA
jgi:hypothetical protein